MLLRGLARQVRSFPLPLASTTGIRMWQGTAAPAVSLLRHYSSVRSLAIDAFDKQPIHPDRKNGSDGKNTDQEKKSGNNNGGQPTPPDLRQLAFWGFASAVLAAIFLNDAAASEPLSWQEFRRNYLDRGMVERIVIVNKTHGRAFLKSSEGPRIATFNVGSVESFDKSLEEAVKENGGREVPVSYHTETSLGSVAMSLLPTLLIMGAIWYLTRRSIQGGAQSGIFNMGKSPAKRFNEDKNVKITFSDVAGADEAKGEIMEFVQFLKEPGKYEALGAKIPRGAILSGPPGTGKTMLAKATAGEAGVPFYSVSGSEFVEMFVGVGASRVRDLFATARKEAPSIVFIDEIDAIGRSRSQGGQLGGGHDEREATLNQVLVEMDGFSTDDHVIVLAGTNRLDVLDKALMRPGRFSRHITVDKPDVNGRKDVYKVYLRKIKLDPEEDSDVIANKLAALTPGFAGADIANCVNEAALMAARDDAKFVEWKFFERAVERVSFGLENKNKVISPEEKKVIAYHEAGHAICGWHLKFSDPLVKVTIIPRGESLGYARYLPADLPLPNNAELMDRMVMALGGRVSEELNFDTTSSGASSDFQKVTQIATNMVMQWGMSKNIGWVNYDEPEGYYTKPYSNDTAESIDKEVREIVDTAYSRCKQLLTEKSDEVKTIAEALLERETLERNDFVKLIGERPYPDNSIEFRYLQGEGVLDNIGKHDKPEEKKDGEKKDGESKSEPKPQDQQ